MYRPEEKPVTDEATDDAVRRPDNTIDVYEGQRRAIQDRIEREFAIYGPNTEERFNEGRGYE